MQPFGRFGTAIFVVLITFFVVFLQPYISVAGSFLQFDFVFDGPAVFAESEWVDMWRQANWPWLVYNMDVRYVAVSTYNLPLRKKVLFLCIVFAD